MSALSGFEAAVAAFALHAAWQVTLLTSAAWCAVRVGRPAARVAHVVWVATLALCVVLPLCATVAGERAARAERAAGATISYDPAAFHGALPAMRRESAWLRLVHRHFNIAQGVSPFALDLPRRWQRPVASTYLLLCGFFLSQLALAWWRMRGIVRRAQPCTLDALVAAVRSGAAAHRLQAPQVRTGTELAGPALAGALWPVLLLPESAADFTGEEVDAVVAHELAHLRRRDPLLHAACSLLLLPVAFHPAAWWAARRVRQTREMACDAEAAGTLHSRPAYAHALLRMAERAGKGSSGSRLRFFSNGLGNGLFGAGLQMGSNSGTMEERMQNLMAVQAKGTRGNRAARVGVCVALGAAAVLVAGMVQVRPAMAGERALPQAQAASTQDGSGPRLLGGEHAREQLRNARRELAEAERKATTDEDRRRIATAREVAAAAEHAIAAAGGTRHDSFVTLPDLRDLHVDLSNLKVNTEAMQHLNLSLQSPEWQQHLQAQQQAMQQLQERLNSPEWMHQQQEAVDKAMAQLNSPEFRAKIEAAGKIDTAKLNAMLADARQQQERAMEQLRSGALQRQLAEAARLSAHNDMPQLPTPPPVEPAGPNAGAAADPVKIAPGVMAGNNLTKKQPVYPPEAKEKKIQGEVVLHAIISEQGTVEQLQVASSPDELLSKSALDAVREWTYKPYLLNGQPHAVDTTITVHYSLAQ